MGVQNIFQGIRRGILTAEGYSAILRIMRLRTEPEMEVRLLPSKELPVTSYNVPQGIKDELSGLAAGKRLSVSYLVAEAIDIAMPELRKRYGFFDKPTHGASGRKKKRAA